MNYNKGYGNKEKDNRRESYNSQESIKFIFSEKGFTDTKGNLREELMTVEAEEIAKNLKDVTTAQLRAFFNEIKALRNRLENKESEENFEKIYPLILMIKSKVQYRYSKDKNKLGVLKNFLFAGIDRIMLEKKEGKGKEAFINFAIFFETVVGYSYEYIKN